MHTIIKIVSVTPSLAEKVAGIIQESHLDSQVTVVVDQASLVKPDIEIHLLEDPVPRKITNPTVTMIFARILPFDTNPVVWEVINLGVELVFTVRDVLSDNFKRETQ